MACFFYFHLSVYLFVYWLNCCHGMFVVRSFFCLFHSKRNSVFQYIHLCELYLFELHLHHELYLLAIESHDSKVQEFWMLEFKLSSVLDWEVMKLTLETCPWSWPNLNSIINHKTGLQNMWVEKKETALSDFPGG